MEPPLERRQVHPARRERDRERHTAAVPRRRRGARHGRRHICRVPAARLRAVHAGRQLHDPTLRRPWSRAGDRAAHRGAARRDGALSRVPGENAGSRFTIALPLHPTPAEGSGAGVAAGGAASPVPDAATLTGVTVLVVDDERDARDMLHAILAAAAPRSSKRRRPGGSCASARSCAGRAHQRHRDGGRGWVRVHPPGAGAPGGVVAGAGGGADRLWASRRPCPRPRGGVRPSRGEADHARGARRPAHTAASGGPAGTRPTRHAIC